MKSFDNKQFYDEISGIYEYLYSEFYEIKRKTLYKIINFFELDKDSLIVDLFCGTGIDINILCELGYKRLVGIDFSKKMLSIARSRNQNNRGVTLIEEDVLNVDNIVGPNQVDLILIRNNSLFHLNKEEIEILIKKIYKILKEGGGIYIEVRNWEMEQYKGAIDIRRVEEKGKDVFLYYFYKQFKEDKIFIEVSVINLLKCEKIFSSATYFYNVGLFTLLRILENVGFKNINIDKIFPNQELISIWAKK